MDARRWGTRAAALAAVALAGAPAAAATIYGSLQQGGAPLADVPIELACPRLSVDARRTDARGAYRFATNAIGRCELRVAGASTQVIVYTEPTRYDYELRRDSAGVHLIRR